MIYYNKSDLGGNLGGYLRGLKQKRHPRGCLLTGQFKLALPINDQIYSQLLLEFPYFLQAFF